MRTYALATEKDLIICKNWEKTAGVFHNGNGRQMYYDIFSFAENVKLKKKNIFENIKTFISGTPVIE